MDYKSISKIKKQTIENIKKTIENIKKDLESGDKDGYIGTIHRKNGQYILVDVFGVRLPKYVVERLEPNNITLDEYCNNRAYIEIKEKHKALQRLANGGAFKKDYDEIKKDYDEIKKEQIGGEADD